jgi:predicted nucleic acid-binding protein
LRELRGVSSEEVTNTLTKDTGTSNIITAARGKRIKEEIATATFTRFEALGIPLEEIEYSRIFELARQDGRTAYDAGYLALAEQKQVPLVTADEHLYNAVRGEFKWIMWIGDCGGPPPGDRSGAQ